MKASDFAGFFEFTLQKIPVSELPKDDQEDFNCEYVFAASDDQGVFDTRYFDEISLLTLQFDSMIDDYIIDNLEEDGCKLDDYRNHWDDALEWCDQRDDYKDTDIREVINCLLNPDLIIDDITSKEDLQHITAVKEVSI